VIVISNTLPKCNPPKAGKPHPHGQDQLQVPFLLELQMAEGTAF
jgi:hypothetical protein